MSDFLEDIAGVRDLQFEDQPLMPRRSRIAFIGNVTATDNPAKGTTDIYFAGAIPAGLTSTYQINVPSITRLDPQPGDLPGPGGMSLGLAQLTLLRLSPQQNVAIHGMSTVAQDRLAICNVGSFNVTLVHMSATGTGFKFASSTGANFVLLPGGIIAVIKDPISSVYRIVL